MLEQRGRIAAVLVHAVEVLFQRVHRFAELLAVDAEFFERLRNGVEDSSGVDKLLLVPAGGADCLADLAHSVGDGFAEVLDSVQRGLKGRRGAVFRLNDVLYDTVHLPTAS